MKQPEQQSGFGTVEVLLVVLVVMVLAVGGVVVFRHHKPTKVQNAASTSASQSTSQQENTTPVQPAQTASQYIDIKEWGIRMPYTGSDTFTYALSADGKSAYIDSKQLTSKDPACAKGGSGAIQRLLPSDSVYEDGTGPTVTQDATQNPTSYVHVGGYYYLFRHAQAACGSVSIADQNQANNAVKALLTNLQEIPSSSNQ